MRLQLQHSAASRKLLTAPALVLPLAAAMASLCMIKEKMRTPSRDNSDRRRSNLYLLTNGQATVPAGHLPNRMSNPRTGEQFIELLGRNSGHLVTHIIDFSLRELSEVIRGADVQYHVWSRATCAFAKKIFNSRS